MVFSTHDISTELFVYLVVWTHTGATLILLPARSWFCRTFLVRVKVYPKLEKLLVEGWLVLWFIPILFGPAVTSLSTSVSMLPWPAPVFPSICPAPDFLPRVRLPGLLFILWSRSWFFQCFCYNLVIWVSCLGPLGNIQGTRIPLPSPRWAHAPVPQNDCLVFLSCFVIRENCH